MRCVFLLSMLMPLIGVASPSDEADAVAVVNKMFQGMAAHDGDIIRSTTLPDALLYATRADGDPAAAAPKGLPIEDFVKRITGLKSDLLERFTATPQVSIRGRLAQVWGEYEFLRDGKFGHCGVDSIGLFKTSEGWKIATLTYTMETIGCKTAK